MSFWSLGVLVMISAGLLGLIAVVRGRAQASQGVYLCAFIGGTGIVFGEHLPALGVAACILAAAVGLIALAWVAFGTDRTGT